MSDKIPYPFIAIPTVAVERITEVSPHGFRLYVYLLSSFNRKTGQCNPSAARCGRALGLSENHVYKLRRELTTAGWVSFEYGAAILLIGNPIQPDRVEEEALSPEIGNPIQPDRQPYPMGYPTLSNGIVAYKEEPEEEPEEITRGINQRNMSAKAPTILSGHLDTHSSVGASKKKTAPFVTPEMQQIFDYWQERCIHPATEFIDKRKTMLRARLKKFSEAQLISAVDGCAGSEWHMANRQNQFEQIFRAHERVEFFIDKLNNPETNRSTNNGKHKSSSRESNLEGAANLIQEFRRLAENEQCR
jgi:hypothetical protein